VLGRRRTRAARTVSFEKFRAALWFWPSVAAALSLVLASALLPVRVPPDTAAAAWLWPSDAEGARALLQVVATSTMAATTLTFSLTVVALQLSSQQFSPRLLREFARDRHTQVVLAILVSTIVIALVGLRGVSGDEPLPSVLLAVVLLLGLASVAALVTFMGHLVRSLRVDTMMAAVRRETVATLHQMYPEHGGRAIDAGPVAPAEAVDFPAARSGFVTVIRPHTLLEEAARTGLIVRLKIRPGDHIVRGTPLAAAWAVEGGAGVEAETIAHLLADAVEVGYERTVEQDAAFGFRQLTDIAVKAISPGINDPVTAAHAVGYCGDLLVELFGRQLGERYVRDVEGAVRVILPDRDVRYYLDIVCAPLRRYGSAEPIVLIALLSMLRDAAVATGDDEQRSELLRQAGLVLEAMSPDLLEVEADAVRDLARRVELAVTGRTTEAFDDRAGETRST